MADDVVSVQAPPPVVVTPDQDVSGELGEVGSKPWKQLFDYFDYKKEADRANLRHQEAFSKIWEYAERRAESKDKDSIMLEVIRLKHRLGGSSLGERPYYKMLMYVNHELEIRKREEILKELENG